MTPQFVLYARQRGWDGCSRARKFGGIHFNPDGSYPSSFVAMSNGMFGWGRHNVKGEVAPFTALTFPG